MHGKDDNLELLFASGPSEITTVNYKHYTSKKISSYHRSVIKLLATARSQSHLCYAAHASINIKFYK